MVSSQADFVVVEPSRTCCDYFARVLDQTGKLRLLTIGTRHGTAGVRAEVTRLKPAIGLAGYIGAKLLSSYQAESLRFRLQPWIDRWSKKQLRAGDNIVSSYGYANDCFKFVRQHGGKTFLDAGNSHIENFWEIISEEHRRWKCPYPPFSPYWYERSRKMLPDADYVLSPSSYVTESFLARGFKREQLLRNMYPVDLALFQPAAKRRPKAQPLTLINTGSVSLRKGSPYLLEAFRIIRRRHPSARLKLTQIIQDDIKPIMSKYRDLPIEWSPPLPHPELAAHLQTGDVFILPSLEDGFARTAAEALSCGLPVILTPNTGARDLIVPNVNGEIVPIREPEAIADAVLKWADRVMTAEKLARPMIDPALVSPETFAETFIAQLRKLGLFSGPERGA